MPRRLFLAPTVGTGRNETRRSAIHDLAKTVPLAGAATLRSGTDWGLTEVVGDDLSALLANPDLRPLPAWPLNDPPTAGQRTALLAEMTERGIPTTGLTASDPYRNYLRRIGRFLNANYEPREDAP